MQYQIIFIFSKLVNALAYTIGVLLCHMCSQIFFSHSDIHQLGDFELSEFHKKY